MIVVRGRKQISNPEFDKYYYAELKHNDGRVIYAIMFYGSNGFSFYDFDGEDINEEIYNLFGRYVKWKIYNIANKDFEMMMELKK